VVQGGGDLHHMRRICVGRRASYWFDVVVFSSGFEKNSHMVP
jgi:hypothetical protein